VGILCGKLSELESGFNCFAAASRHLFLFWISRAPNRIFHPRLAGAARSHIPAGSRSDDPQPPHVISDYQQK